VGGCIAANVHGKNQVREGTFVDSVLDLTLFHPDRGVLRLSPDTMPGLFDLTCGGYGLTDRWDAYGRVDVTAAAYGDLHVEPGVAFHPLVREGGGVPTVTLVGSAHVLTDFGTLRLGPQLTALAAWRVGASRRHLVYAGADAGTLVPGRPRLLAGPLAGGELRVGARAGLVLEVKWLSPWYDVKPLAPTWVSPADRGYLFVLLGCNLYWGNVR